MSDILLAGYEPFGEFERNPARQLAIRLDGDRIGDATVIGREFPVVFDRLRPELEAAVDEHDPEIVCGLGLAAGRNALSLERVGINLRDTGGIPDNDDREPVDQPAVHDGPNAYFTTLPVRSMKEAMLEAGVPTTLSTDAGTHACNNFLYLTRHLAETSDRAFRAGFVHVPFSHEQAAARDDGEPSLALEAMRDGLLAGLEEAVGTP
ncbi:pyrrolidone-carboxylate peptidase [Natronorubrum sp. JWXQ-INN-674]|uniref:Pyroglutamyl-peptidase I n=1 Tax=Natronorubrum halalkaliphilum TaxID=2691917 RepID=A0A6B0VN55_9EURY|nr:pyrrolidone-carboxylate peptidase [Natronorubrum halalkaliphilum]MXV63030.1 pyrrolidone-carboxylate peptidase [Natronorubrum halalkaliphilum]